MSSQDFGKFVHVKIPQSGCYNQVNHGGHTEQLCLVDRDLGVDGVLTLLLLHCIIHSVHNTCHHLLIKIPGDILEKVFKIFYYSIKILNYPKYSLSQFINVNWEIFFSVDYFINLNTY